ncbi:adenylyl-sulfate kinase [Bacillus haimaensis]|uniref:adenylyl-sulfate kinase n=1 Tax=Bacillus haimaensis TaxID=3160967 RepID=UPI003AA99E85
MDNNKSKNITWHQSGINKFDRQKQLGHKSVMIWFTGLSGSGKSTVANALQQELYKRGISVYLLDGDNLRHGLNNNLSFSAEDRKESVRRTAEVGKLLVDAGVVTLAALISPFEEDRRIARTLYEVNEFVEVYVKCTLQECEKRDPKGLYAKARKGEIRQFTGIDQPYEVPKNPEIIIDTDTLAVDESVEIIINFLFNKLRLMDI